MASLTHFIPAILTALGWSIVNLCIFGACLCLAKWLDGLDEAQSQVLAQTIEREGCDETTFKSDIHGRGN